VGADSLAGRKETHEYPALSLAKTKSVAELTRWAQGRAVWLSWKLDGLTLVATYDDGALVRVVTRGDGHAGTNVTHLADGVSGLPRRIAASGHVVVRGEAVISYGDFRAFLASSREEYANPRNLASGSLTLKDIDELKRRRLRWIPFTLVAGGPSGASWGEQMAFLAAAGLEPVERERVERPDEDALRAAIDRWTVRVTGGANPYPVDGLVVCYDDVEYAKTGPVTGHHAVRAGMAFKWRDEEARTRLERVEWSCAVSSISPVAVFAPVELEGTTVRRASLCNLSECERLGLGGPGTELSVIKSNKIIPKVVAVVRKEGAFEIPAACPVCGAPTRVRQSEGGTRTLLCTNDACAARNLRLFMRFVSKQGMDIDGLAGETLAKFINLGWIRTFADVYRLDARRDEIARLEGFGPKSADNIVRALAAARRRPAVDFLVALSIPLCGPDVARRLLSAYTLDGLFAAAADAARADDPSAGGSGVFSSIDGIGPATSAAFVAWYADARNRAAVDDLRALVELTLPDAPAAGGACAGLTFVITGETRRFANRAAFKAYVQAQGGSLAGSVSSKTDFLVNNDPASASGKNRKAAALGVPVLTEDEFVARYGGL
jgi:DNA ligase (NAD+)